MFMVVFKHENRFPLEHFLEIPIFWVHLSIFFFFLQISQFFFMSFFMKGVIKLIG